MEKIKAFIKLDKRMKIISITCMISGIILCAIGFNMVDYDVYKLNPSPESAVESKEKEIPLQDIAAIEIDVDRTTIVLEESESEMFELSYGEYVDEPLEITTSSKTLSIQKKNNNIQWFSFNWMNIERDQTQRITLRVPKQFSGDIDITNSYSTIAIKDIKGSNVSIENAHASIDMKNIEAKKVSIKNAYGDINAEHIVSENALFVDNAHATTSLFDIKAASFVNDSSYTKVEIEQMDIQGDIDIENNHKDVSLMDVKSKKSTIDASYGNVTVRKWVSDTSVFDVTHGDVSGDILGIESDYHIVTDVENGSNNMARERNMGKDKSLHITTSYGDVEVAFAQ